jgi:hypothetical protein
LGSTGANASFGAEFCCGVDRLATAQIEAMRGAFLKAHDALDLTRGPGVSATDFVVTKIVEIARSANGCCRN